jgi:hypothetical protein
MKYKLFGVGLKGKSPNITAQHRINCYVEPIVDEDVSQLSINGSPGMDLFTDFGDTPCRGRIVVGSLMYLVHRGTLWEVNNAGTQTSRGTISTTAGRVDMATDGDKILIVDGTLGHTYTISTTTLISIASADFPDNARTCTWQDGYFIVATGNTFRLSVDGIVWDPLDVGTAESAPDGIVRVFADHGELMLFGETTVEFWANTGGADFPYQPIKGATKEWGLAARWSLTKFDDSVAFLGKNLLGQVQPMRMQGYNPQAMSSPELDSIVNRYATVSDATAYAHMFEGHPLYRINFPTVNKSWEYDALTKVWCERQSGLSGGRHRGEMAVDFVNKIRIFDYANGRVYTLNALTLTENGESFPFELTSKKVVADYDPFSIDQIFLDFETGVGLATGQGSKPRVMFTVSRDGGHSWGNEQWTDLGAIGKYETRVEYRQLGTADSFNFRVRITDPVKRRLVNAGVWADK